MTDSLISSVIQQSCVLCAAYFSCVVKLLYNLVYMQVTLQMSLKMSEAERQGWRSANPTPEAPVSTLEDAMALTIHAVDHTQLYINEQYSSARVTTLFCSDMQDMEKQVSS